MGPERLNFANLRRIAIVGTSGSGKTTLARDLSQLLGVKHIELDALNWLPNWKDRPREEFRGLLKQEIQAAGWVAEGNYSKARDILWSHATAIIWLNYSFPRVIFRSVKRAIRRVAKKEILWSGNRETFRLSFLSTDSVILWAVRTYGKHKQEYSKILRSPQYGHLQVHEFRNQNETDRFLKQVRELVAGGDHPSAQEP